MTASQIEEIKAASIGLFGGLLGLFNKPILAFVSSFKEMSEIAEMYSAVVGAVVVTLTAIYMVQKILGKRK